MIAPGRVGPRFIPVPTKRPGSFRNWTAPLCDPILGDRIASGPFETTAIVFAVSQRRCCHAPGAMLEPIFGKHTRGATGAVIDISAIIVTLFGTGISLGIGALQIGKGMETVTGAGPFGNTFMVGTMAFSRPRSLSRQHRSKADCLVY
ncbi:MAG TPA: BCCT family transporter [Wenzhouxiangella sp.]|nr:BCCT family transporter [Wenzhouxiangella sp.]